MRGDLARFHQAQLHVVDRQRHARIVVEALQRQRGVLRAFAAHRHAVAAALDRHVERLFDLAQVLVERPAQVLQARVVVPGCDEFGGWNLHGRPYWRTTISPRSECGNACVMFTSTIWPIMRSRWPAARPAARS
jgi:hypothetical protein